MRMKKDILFLCQFFYPEYNSSATLPFDTAKHLAAHGFSVNALCGYPKEYCREKNVTLREDKCGIGIRRIRYFQMARGRRLSRLINYFSFTVSAFFHLAELRKYESVIVYSNPPVLPIVAVLGNILFGTKIVFVAYDMYPEVAYASKSLRRGGIIDRVMRWINHIMYSRASCAVALTDEMKAFLVLNRPEISPEKIVTIANWAHEKERKVDPADYLRFGYAEDSFIVSYFGNMGICQDMETLMGAAEKLKEHPKVRFLITGHGNKKDSVQQRIRENGLRNVQFLDYLTGEDFEQAVAVSSCCVVSLERGLKGTCAPSKYYSYLQGGQPVLAVVEKGSYLEEEVINWRIGYAVSLGDSDMLAHVIEDMADHPEEREAMRRRAHDLYEREYAMEIGLGKYADVLREVLNSVAPKRPQSCVLCRPSRRA